MENFSRKISPFLQTRTSYVGHKASVGCGIDIPGGTNSWKFYLWNYTVILSRIKLWSPQNIYPAPWKFSAIYCTHLIGPKRAYFIMYGAHILWYLHMHALALLVGNICGIVWQSDSGCFQLQCTGVWIMVLFYWSSCCLSKAITTKYGVMENFSREDQNKLGHKTLVHRWDTWRTNSWKFYPWILYCLSKAEIVKSTKYLSLENFLLYTVPS